MNIFSLGMDQLAAKIAQRGIPAIVYNHAEADTVVAEIAAHYRAGDRGPIILIGHSLGANAVMTMAQSLNRDGIPVALVIPFDGTASYYASKNVACVLNLTQNYAYMRSGAGFHGKLMNVNVAGESGIDHFTIDKAPRLQAQALNSVLGTARAKPAGPVSRTQPRPSRRNSKARPRLRGCGRESEADPSFPHPDVLRLTRGSRESYAAPFALWVLALTE
jgi:acetyl esterase/lipase